MIYDLLIAGGGPAGVAGGVYAARKRLKTLFITYDFGGQSLVSPDIRNWIGARSVSGEKLAKNLEEHLRDYEGETLTIKTGVKITSLKKDGAGFKITADNGETYSARVVLLAVGASRRKLAVPGAEEFDQKGLTYCASCDGPLFADKDVAVIGGGNAGFETAGQLLAYTKSVTLLHRGPQFKADEITAQKLLKHPRFKALTNAEPTAIKGDKFVQSLEYKNKDTGEIIEISAEGIFVEIGLIPNTDFLKDIVETNKYGSVIVDPATSQTKTPGLWAAGDCTNALYHQNNIAAGNAVTAIEDIYVHLHLK